MKKTQIWAVILPLMIIFFSSCEEYHAPAIVPFGPGVSQNVEVSCEYQTPILSPRFDCKGKQLQYPKVMGWNNATCRKVESVYFSDALLNSTGYYFKGKPVVSDVPPAFVPPISTGNGSGNLNNSNGWSAFPWDWLLGLILAGALIAAFISIFRQFWRKDKDTANSTNITSSTTTTTNYKAEAELLERVMAGMSNCDVTDVAVEFPNGGPRIRMKGNDNKKKGVINLKKEEKPADQKPDQK